MNIDAVLHQAHGMWFEDDQDLKPPVLVDYRDPSKMPPVNEYPIAASCSPLSVVTHYYRRRKSDGMYGGDDRLYTGESTISEDLVLAMATGYKDRRKFRLSEAMVILGSSCERCMNALGFEYGMSWGYEEGSEQWVRSRTVCKMCVTEPIPRLDLENEEWKKESS